MTCKYKEHCKFAKKGICAFKHIPLSKLGATKIVQTKAKVYDEDIDKLNVQIHDLQINIRVHGMV